MLAEFIKQTTTTTGTGSLTIAQVSGFPTFADAFVVGEPISFAVLDDATGAPLEMCQGHLSNSTTLVIDRVLTSYSGGTLNQTNPTALSLTAGTKRVICTPSAGGLVAAPVNIPQLSTNNLRLLYPDGQTIGIGGHAAVTVTPNIVIYVPIVIKSSQLIDAVLFRLTAVVAGSTAKAGIYTAGPDGKPGIKLVESSAVSTVANSPPEIVCALTSRRYKPGMYYIGITFSHAVTVNAPQTSVCSQPLMGGNGNMLADTGSTYEATSAGVLPNTSAVTSGLLGISATPLLALRLA